MSKICKYLSGFVSVVIVLGAVFGGGYYCGTRGNESEAEIVEESETSEFDLKLPGEVEKRTVTKDEVESRIYEIGELSTYCGEYTVSKSVDESRYFIDKVKIPGTKNTITIECTGNVKIGYDMSEINVKVEEDTIYVSLPEARITDNYIIWDSVTCVEENSILNPIEFSQYEELVKEMESEGLEDVESKGIYEKADENFMKIVRAFLSEFEDYTIVFM